MSGFRRLAIADRAGPALRCLSAVADLNAQSDDRITAVALHCDADRFAWFVRAADEAVPLHVATPADVTVDAVMAAVHAAGADAVWLGWNPLVAPEELARRCEAEGVVFVGPDAKTLAALTDDAASRRVAQELGIPTVVGEPVERHARRLEVQLVGDGAGTVWALGVRDSSVQRRRERVLQESSSTCISPEVEQRLRADSARLATAIGYCGVGTAEFVADLDSGDVLFRTFHPRLQAGHLVTEATTGVDLVALSLRIAAGHRLEAAAPPTTGHAVGVRLLAADPERDFVPAGGRLSFLRLPVGGGVRVDTGYTEGDVIDAAADPLLATLVASGRDRSEALARLRRALLQLIVVIDGGATTKAVALQELDSPALADASYDCQWLDDLVDAGRHLPRPDPLALAVAAVHAYETEEAVVREQFLQTAARWRPALPETVGHDVQLRMRGVGYRFTVTGTGPQAYRVANGPQVYELSVQHLSSYECAVSCAGAQHRVVLAASDHRIHVEIDGTPHLVSRDDGVVVRAPAPAFVVDVKAVPGQHVGAGEPLVVLESMKMLTTVTAPVAGMVADVVVGMHTQVEVGAPLVRIGAAAPDDFACTPVDFGPISADLGSAPDAFALLRGYLLGYDVDTKMLRRLPELLLAQDVEVLDIFTDICALSRRDPDDDDDGDRAVSAQEHLFTYLSRLDPAGLPTRFVDRLALALARYGVFDFARTRELEQAAVLMYRSFLRTREAAPFVLAVLERWLHRRRDLMPLLGDEQRAVLARLAHVTPGRADDVADLAREVHYRFIDEPLLERARAAADARVDGALQAMCGGADVPPAAADELVAAPRPMRTRLRTAYLGADDDATRDRLLEVRVRRYYRTQELGSLEFVDVVGRRACRTTYRDDGADVRLVAGYCPLSELAAFVTSAATSYAGPVVVDVESWRAGPLRTSDELAAEVTMLLPAAPASGDVRVDVTVTTDGPEPEHLRTQHVSLRADGGHWAELPLYRNMHPMLARRIELWRWSGFDLVRLPSAEDVYAFVATAKANPADTRIVAMAEVRDLSPATDSTGRVTGYPLLERIFAEALTTIRHAMPSYPRGKRPSLNRVVLYVRPPWDVPAGMWRRLAHRMAPLSNGLGIDTVQVRVRFGDDRPDAVIEVRGAATSGVTVQVRPVSDRPVPPSSDYWQRVRKSERAGAPYPYELVRMITPPLESASDFPPGSFVEHDLTVDGTTLVAVGRPPGNNECGIVAGVITSTTAAVPEGMARVALLGDPTRGLGNLAEAECRRIIAAIDLAEQRGLPLEWYALSSGARIAMDSGTENMDWISAVLRRLIEFTQRGGEVNIVVTGINVGAQPYWNAEATMLMHTRGILVMTPSSAMVLTGKASLDYSGGVSAEDNTGIGGYERVMGPNGQGQYWAPTLADACALLLRHYEFTYVVPGEHGPRRTTTGDPFDRDVRSSAHRQVPDCDFTVVGDVFSPVHNPERKKPFDMRSVMRAVADTDCAPLERWARWRDAETAIVWDARIGGIPVCLLGIESRPLPRTRFVPADGPPMWTSGTLFPQSSRKLARAINSASGNRPVVVLANLSGFDGSPESMRKWQLEYGAEIGRAVTNFRGPIVFVVVSRYHGGAFVVFSKRLNESMEIAAVEGSYASVIGGAPAAAVVFSREVRTRAEQDPRVVAAPRDKELLEHVRAEKLKEVADAFDHIHDINRAQRVGSVDLIVPARELRPYVVGALERGLGLSARPEGSPATSPSALPS